MSLDEAENMLKTHFGIECACAGKDDDLKIYVTGKDLPPDDIIALMTDRMHMNKAAFSVHLIDEIPKNDAGKTLYAKLN